MDEQGKIVSQGKLTNDQDSITEYIESIGSELKELAMEAGPSWYWLYELLDGLDINVHLAHPKRVKAIASARVKTDKIDSTVLAHLLRTNLLPEAYIPDRETWLQFVGCVSRRTIYYFGAFHAPYVTTASREKRGHKIPCIVAATFRLRLPSIKRGRPCTTRVQDKALYLIGTGGCVRTQAKACGYLPVRIPQ